MKWFLIFATLGLNGSNNPSNSHVIEMPSQSVCEQISALNPDTSCWGKLDTTSSNYSITNSGPTKLYLTSPLPKCLPSCEDNNCFIEAK